ncbi:MAG: hypothetical protein HY023_09210 [Chloroflexi bacterium]|nr:hypothetical protein [Chloroflexota bacterium]
MCSCSPAPRLHTPRAALDSFESRLDALNTAYGDAQWRKYLGRATAAEINALEAERSALLLDDEIFAFVMNHRADVDGDAALARRLALVHRALLEARATAPREIYELRNRIDRQIVAFKPIVAGETLSRAEQRDMLRKDPDRARRQTAWLALGPLAATVEKDVLELMRRRNRIAQSLGCGDYPSLALSLAGLDRQMVERLFAELTDATDAPYRAFLDRAASVLGLADPSPAARHSSPVTRHLAEHPERSERASPVTLLRPWDLTFAVDRLAALPDAPFPKSEIVSASLALAEGLGLDRAAHKVRVDFADIPYGGLCFGVHPPDDVRILANPRDGHAYYSTMFHEFGHALHNRHVNPPSPILRDEPGPFNEGQACTLQRFAADPDWLATRRGLDRRAIDSYRRGWAQTMRVRFRTLMGLATFEYAAYATLALDPAADLDLIPLYRETMERYTLVSWSEADGVGWADNPFWTSYPIYLQNYVVAEAIASRTHGALRREFRALFANSDVGEWLAEHYWRPAATIEWQDKIARATGGPLSARALIADLQIADC